MPTIIQVWNMALGRLEPQMSVSSVSEQSNRAQILRTYYDQARTSLLAEWDWPFAKVLVNPLTPTGNTPPDPWSVEYARPPCLKVRSISVQPVSSAGNGDTVISGTASSIDFGGIGGYGYIGGPTFQGGAQPYSGSQPTPTVIPFETGSVIATAANVAALAGGYAPTVAPGGTLPVIWTNITTACGFVTADVQDPNAWEPGFLNAFAWHLAAEIAMSLTSSGQVLQACLQGKNAAMERAINTEGNEGVLTNSYDAEWITARNPQSYNGWGYGDGY